jgi:hypothetical protein
MNAKQRAEYAELVARMAALLVEAYGEEAVTDDDRADTLKWDVVNEANFMLDSPVF